MKDTKSILKEAREAIKSKNYETSLKLCKQILKDDKDNYTALVFLALSLQETGQSQQALDAFKSAIKINSINSLAWNGLVNYYEKIDSREAKKELVKTYISLLKIETLEKKLLEYSQKLCCLHEYGDVAEMASAIHSVIKNQDCSDTVNLWVALVDLMSKVKEVPSNLNQIYEEGLRTVLGNKKTVCTEYYIHLLNLLYRQRKIDELLEHAKKMHSLYEIDSNCLEWICKVFNEAYIESTTMIESPENMQQFYESLLKLKSKCPTGLFTKSILLFREDKLIEAKELLIRVVEACPEIMHAWILLSQCCIKLHLIPDALQSLAKAEKLLKSSNSCNKEKLQRSLRLSMIEALSNSSEVEDLKGVSEMIETLDDDTKTDSLSYAIRANINLGNYAQAKLLLTDFKTEPITHKLLTSKLLHKQGKHVEALQLLESEDVPLAEWWLQIGSLHSELGQRSKCLMPLLKAAKLDPSNYKCFLFLGHYYRDNNEPDKARRCYEKAFKINANCVEAGIELSKIYRKLKNWDANLTLLQSLTVGVINKQNCWAWIQLGLNYLEQEDYEKAINSLRFVIRIDETNMHCWESLADAYLAKGAYTSALKCYTKASELSQSALYPLLQIANIKQLLGEYTEARADFEEIILSNRHYVPALKGMSETCMYQAKECYRNQRMGAARDYAQLAADKLIVAIQQRSDLACLWKLLGDGCYFVTKLPEIYCCLLLQASFVEDKDIDREKNKIVEKEDLFVLATRCYCKSLSLIEDNSLIWHDLAACYLSHSLNTTNKELFEELISKAQAVAQHCTVKSPTHWQHWNLLGNIACSQNPPNYRLAQHAFIKATIADNNSAVSWSNLGTLYLILADYKLANKAFSQAQRSDPNYVYSWIGQALLAEYLDHEDAMDLFRHSTQLGVHQQGALGYGHWVCRTLMSAPLDAVIYSIHNMHAVPVACDNLTWYTENNPDDGSAWNMLGLLRERMGLKTSAAEAFRNALVLTKGKYRDCARVNYGRLLVKLGRFKDAIEMFGQVEAATFNSVSGLALALFKDQQYEQSYESYEQALHWLTEEQSSQSDLLVALASMAYMFQGVEPAKTLLFQSIRLDKPSPWGYFATLSLGLLHDDVDLAQLVFNELGKLKDRKNCLQHYAALSAYLYLLKGEFKKSVREVSKIIHRHPDEAQVYLTLASLLIRLQNELKPSPAAARCAEISMRLGQTNTDITKVLCLVSQASCIVGDQRSSLIAAQKAVHCYPNVAEGWAMLASTGLKSRHVQKERAKDILKHLQRVSETENLTQWVERTMRSL